MKYSMYFIPYPLFFRVNSPYPFITFSWRITDSR